MQRIPSIKRLVEHGIVLDEEDALALRKALFNGHLVEAARIMESPGCTTKDIKRRHRNTYYQVDFFLSSDAETLISIDCKSWFIGDPAVTFNQLEVHG